MKRGMTLVEIMLGAALVVVVGAAMVSVVGSAYDARSALIGQNTANTNARTPMDALADHLRNAQANSTANYAVFAAAAGSDVTLYDAFYDYSTTPPTRTYATIRYWRDTTVTPAALKKTVVKSGVTTTSTILSGLSSFQLTYYTSGNIYTPAGGSWITTTNPQQPTVAERPLVGAVQINATVTTTEGYSRQLSTLVRLRNSPYKTTL